MEFYFGIGWCFSGWLALKISEMLDQKHSDWQEQVFSFIYGPIILIPIAFIYLRKWREGSLPSILDSFEKSKDKDLALELIKERRNQINTDEETNRLYEYLKKVDMIILKTIPSRLKDNYPRKIYFLRLNILEKFLSCILEGKKVVFTQEDLSEKEQTIDKFCQLVADEYYTSESQIGHQPVTFDFRVFEEYIIN